MRITYDEEANAAYLYLVDEMPPGAVAETVPLYSNLDTSAGEPRLNGINLDLLPASLKEEAKRT
jgi:hypothetical protein